jgi:hypothetical protein
LLEDILAYKETFRHDLLIPTPQQQKMALHIYVKYLFPQLLLNQSTYNQYHTESTSMKSVNTSSENEGFESISNKSGTFTVSSKSRKWNPVVNGNNFDYLYVKEETVQEIWQTIAKRVTIAEYAPYFQSVVATNATMNDIVTTMSSPTKATSTSYSNARSNSPVPSRIINAAPLAASPPTGAATGVIANMIAETGATFLPLTRAQSAVGNPTNDDSSLPSSSSSTYFPNGHWVLPSNIIVQVFWLLFTKRVNIPEEEEGKSEANQNFSTRTLMAPTTPVSTASNTNASGNSSFWSWFNRSGSSNVSQNASNVADAPRTNAVISSNTPRLEFVPNEPQIELFDDIISELMNILRNYPLSTNGE